VTLETMIVGACAKRGKQAVQEILSIESEIQSLHDKVARLREGEHYNGRKWMMEAQQATDEAERNTALDKARDRFLPCRSSDDFSVSHKCHCA